MKDLEPLYELFDQLSDGVCLSDMSGNVEYMNPAAGRILNVSRADRHLRNACDLLCGSIQLPSGLDAKTDCPLRRPDDGTQAVTFAGRHGPRSTFNWRDDRVHRHDAWRDVRVRCLRARLPVMGDGEEEVHLVLIEDGSAEAELKRHREDWRNMIAHDLRQPLSAIYSGLRLLEEIHPKSRGGNPPDGEETLVESSLRSCRRMMELLDLYLDVARFDAGAMPVKLAPIDLGKALEDAVDEASALSAEAGVLVELDVEPGLAAIADQDLFDRLARNLLDNAIKYNVRGGTVRITAARKDGDATISFKDSGRGIDHDDLPRIFDRYYQAEARRAGRIKGNGLGLTFVREALNLMGGAIAVESEPGKGSDFVVHLKAAPGGEAAS